MKCTSCQDTYHSKVDKLSISLNGLCRNCRKEQHIQKLDAEKMGAHSSVDPIKPFLRFTDKRKKTLVQEKEAPTKRLYPNGMCRIDGCGQKLSGYKTLCPVHRSEVAKREYAAWLNNHPMYGKQI